jgi:hypothetical protein
VLGVEGVQVGDDRVGGAVAEDGHRRALAGDASRMLVDRAQLLGREGTDVGRALPSAQVGHRPVPARAVQAEDGVDRQRLRHGRGSVVGVEGPAARLIAADRRLQQRLDLGDGAGGQDVVARARDVLDAQAAARQPGAHVLLRGRGDAEALRVLRGRDEVVVARARAIEEAAQERVLGVGVGMGQDEADAQALRGRGRAGAQRLGDRARDVGHQDAVGRGGARHRGDAGEQHDRADGLSHGGVNAPEVGNMLGLRAR